MKRLIAFSLLLGLAGCAAQAPKQQPDMANRPATPLECVPAKLPPPRPSPLLNWQAYQANLVMSPRQDLGLIINQAEKAYNEKPTADAVMRLAIALALSNNPQRQERAQRLFNNLRIDPRLKLEEQQFATVQANHLNELRLMRQERTRLEQRLAQEQQAKDALDEKIRALTAIELKMNERQRSETPAEVNIDDKASKPASSANDTKNPAETPAVKPKDGDSANVPPKDATVTAPAPSPEPTQPAKPTAPETPAPQEPDAKKPEIKATPKSDAKPAPDVSAPATTVAPNPSAPAPASKGQPAPKPSSPATTPDADAPATKP